MQWLNLLTPDLKHCLERGRVGEVMATRDISIPPTAIVRDALQLLQQRPWPTLVVVASNAQGGAVPLGMFSPVSVAERISQGREAAVESLSVANAVVPIRTRLQLDTPLIEALELIERSPHAGLSVSDVDGTLRGLLTEALVLQWLQQQTATASAEVWVECGLPADGSPQSVEPESDISPASPHLDSVLASLTNHLAGMAYRCRSDRLWALDYVSEGCIELTGYQPQDLLGQKVSYADIVLVQDRDAAWSVVQQAIANGQPFQISYRIVTAAGDQKWVREKGRCAKGEGCKVLEGFIDDISDLQAAKDALAHRVDRERAIGRIAQHIRQSLDLEQSLRVATSDVRHLLQVDRVAICRNDAGSRCLAIAESVNPDWPSMLGHDLIFACSSFEDCVPAMARDATPAFRDIQDADIPAAYVESLAQFGVRAHAVVPIWQSDRLWGLLVAQHCATPYQWRVSDLDLLRQLCGPLELAIQQGQLYRRMQQLNTDLEQQVQQRTTELQLAFDFEATLKRIADRVRDSLDVNQIANTAVRELALCLGVICCNAALYDRDRGTSTIYFEYAAGAPSQRRVSQMDDFPELHYQLLEGQYFQFCSLVPNPLRGPTAMLACPIADDRGVLGALWLVRSEQRTFNEQDIRLVLQVANQCAIAIRQARLYQASQAQVRELERLNVLKDDFVSTVSHELRTPIASIRLAIQMLGIQLDRELGLKTELAKAPESRNPTARYFSILHQECEREIKLIEDLLDFQRLDDAGNPPTPQPINVTDWLPRVVAPFQDRARERQQILTVDCAHQLPYLISDSTYLERIISELLINACKYTPPGEAIAAIARCERNEMQLRVKNTGVVIPAAELPHVFDKFYRVPGTDPWEQGGTGLGLALVRKLVRHLGGMIRVESTEQHTQFEVALPLELPVQLSAVL